MLWLVAPAVVVLIWALYSISPAKKAARLVDEAVKTVDELQAETDACREECRSEVSNAANARSEEIQLIRMQAISMEELKKHFAGLRLQPLRDVGIRSMADLLSWSQGRLEGLRGVGPKSAATIPGIVQRISSAVKAQPIADPEPPFLRDKERNLVLAIYRELKCERLLAKVPPEFRKLRNDTNETREQVRSKTRFFQWIWSFGNSQQVRDAIEAAQASARSYEKGNDADELCEAVRALLSECRAVRSSGVDTSTLADQYNEHWIDYDVVLGRSTGSKGRVRWTPHASLQSKALHAKTLPPLTSVSHESDHTSWQVGSRVPRESIDETLQDSEQCASSRFARV